MRFLVVNWGTEDIMVISVLAPIKHGESSCLEIEHFYTVVGTDQYN
jgi:hypothetical protein